MGLIYSTSQLKCFNRLYDPLTFMCFSRVMHGGVSGGGGGGRDHIKDPLEVGEFFWVGSLEVYENETEIISRILSR